MLAQFTDALGRAKLIVQTRHSSSSGHVPILQPVVCAEEIPHTQVLCYSTVLVLEDKELHQLLVGDGYTDLVGTVDEGLDHIPCPRDGHLWFRLWLIVSIGGCWHFGENACLRLKVLGLTLAIVQDSARCFPCLHSL